MEFSDAEEIRLEDKFDLQKQLFEGLPEPGEITVENVRLLAEIGKDANLAKYLKSLTSEQLEKLIRRAQQLYRIAK